MNVGERLKKIIKHLNHNTSSFSRSIGLTNNVTLMRIVKGESAPSYSTIQKINDTYPNINIEWLISGAGHMLKDSVKDSDWYEKALLDTEKEIKWHKELIKTLQNALDSQTQLTNRDKPRKENAETD